MIDLRFIPSLEWMIYHYLSHLMIPEIFFLKLLTGENDRMISTHK